MRRSLLSSTLVALLTGLLASVAVTPAQAITVTGRGFSNHSHDQFSTTTSAGSPFFTGSTNSSDGTQYTIGPSNGLTGSIRTPNGPGSSPTGSSTTVSGHVSITGNATSVGADAAAGTADDWLNGNGVPAGVTLSYDILFTISSANGMNLITANGNTGNGLAIANTANQNYGNLDAGEQLNFSTITASNYVWGGAPTESFSFTPISTGTTRFTAFRSNSLDIASEGATLSDGTNTWGFGTSTGTVVSNIPITNTLSATFSPAGGDVPLTLKTDVGAWALKGFQLSTPISYDVIAVAPPVNADFNADTFVDGADFLIWQRGYGLATGALLADGDANGDGAVNDLDLAAWNANFGAGPTPPISAVPEPAALTLAGIAILASAAMRRRS
ncbi:PEP-CTERM sorting domain-containing protein [Lacipirellula parvula]|uniref:Ice-binding protein C-terminal domain-containing protein n=1 Tax=Lacipirellula parvula TaxID=2650471 RepID=A0A5K7XMI8_9BACT|nr:PEP-CTERM sorting domain-containing protein [Lacipirellula parvula]BBO35833.1 hypothetical protein PLANPX_5445 [Lacipirellula parvula]